MKKKALIVTALAGFIRSFLTQDIEMLQEMGYEIYCAANKEHPGNEGIEEYFQEHDVKFYQIDFSSNKPFSKETLKAYKQLKKIIEREKFDVIHCHTPIAGAITRWVSRNKRKNGTKVIYTTHGFYFHKGASKKSWIIFGTIERFMSRFCDAIITINNEDFNNAKTMHCKNVYHINGVGVDINKFKNVQINREEYRKSIGVDNSDIMILSIGELSKRKNQKVVVEAIAELNNPNLIFVHCGNAMNREATTEEIKQIAKEKNVRIKLLGLRKDIPEICHCADIGTISSTREGLGLAGIEMIASGLPIVASNVHGIVDYVQDGVNGFLANPYSIEDFKKGINELISGKLKKEYISDSVLEFDKNKSFKQVKSIYKKILK